ncbi:MAG: VWA domain-containing protein [Acidobacteriota bacterium]
MRFGPIAASTLALLIVPLALPAQSDKKDARVREEARVTLVEVPVNVIDKAGRPVENLKAEDFEVFDDGKSLPITGFEVLDQRRPVPAAAPGQPLINPAAQRHFLVLFDLSFGSPRGVVNARKAARDFVVTRMKELDMAAVATYSVEQGMKLLVTFTRDRTQLAAAIDTLGFPTLQERSSDPLGFVIRTPSPSSATGFASIGGGNTPQTTNLDVALEEAIENLELNRAKSLRAMYRDRVTRFLGSFAQLAQALDAVRGRKHILYLSEGFDSRELSGSTSDGGGSKEAEWVIRGQSWKVDSDSRFGNLGLRSAMTQALSFFNRSDCVVHAIDIAGLKAGADIAGSDQTVSGQDSLQYIAAETGGEFLNNTNELASSFDQLLNRTGLMYLLAVQPVRVPETGKFHTLKVRVKDHAYRLSHRTGYYEPKSYETLTPMEKKLATSSAIAAAVPKTDIPAWLLAAPFPTGSGAERVPVIVEIPGDRLLVGHTAPKMDVSLFVYAIDGKGNTKDYLFQSIGLDLDKTAAALRKGGIKYYGELMLPAGEYTVRLLVRNEETGRFGVTVVPLTVPDEAAALPFVLPPLFLADGEPWILVKGKPKETASAGEYPFAIGGESFIPAALADIRSGEDAQVCLIAYNFPTGSEPLEYTGRILGADGRPKGKLDLELVKSSGRERQGARKVLFTFRPSGLDPGRYALAVTVRDPRSGKSSEASFPFDIQ